MAADATRVMVGLRNPRGLAFGPSGSLYVAEAGRGDDPSDGIENKCFPGIVFPGTVQPVCYGATGAVSRMRDDSLQPERLVTGLPSFAPFATGSQARGPDDLAVLEDLGEPGGSLYVVIGLQADPAVREVVAEAEGMARLVHVASDGRWSYRADFGVHESRFDPDGEGPDTNPYGLLAEGHKRLIVADSGANALLGVHGRHISPLAVLPPTTPPAPVEPDQSVPTSVARGPDGSYYVGELTGFPLRAGQARIWRVARRERASEPELACTGFTAIIDIAFDEEGRLYVLEHISAPPWAPAGTLFQVTRCEDGQPYEGAPILTGLDRPTSVAVGPDGIYVTNHGISPGTGEVLRIPIPALR